MPVKTNKQIILVPVFLLFLSAVRTYAVAPADTVLVNRLIKKGFSLIYEKKGVKPGQLKVIIDSIDQAIAKREFEPPSSLILLRAEYEFANADYRKAADLASKALEQSSVEKDINTNVHALYFLGKFCSRTGSFQESIDYYSKAADIAKSKGIRKIVPKALEGQSVVYKALGNVDSFRESIARLIHSSYLENDTSYITRGLYLLGTLYSEDARDFRKCDSVLRECFYIASLVSDTVHLAVSQANMGWNYYLAKMYDSSVTCYKRALDYSLPAKLNGTSANAYGNLGTIYRDIGKSQKALEYYRNAISIASAEDAYNRQWIYKDISDLYIGLRDTANAYLNYVLHKKYSDLYLSRTSLQGLSDARLRYEIDNHRKEVELLSLKIKNQKLILFGSAGLTLFIMLLFLLLYRGSKLKAKRRLSDMNRRISELTQANLRQQMNPHFIFNTLNSIQYYMYQHDKLATNNYLTKFTSLMRKVLENSQHTSVPIKDEFEALRLYLELENLRFKDRFEYEIIVDEEIDPLLFKIPTMLIQPYVENSICHGMMPGETKGRLKIQLDLEKDHITCVIEDNGIGREAAMKRRNAQGQNHNSLGTRIVESRLDLVNSLYGTSLKTVYTDLKNNDGEPAGTRVEIHIPIIT